MDYGLAFKYVFQDPDWIKKFLVGAALLLFFWLLVPPVFVAGYYIKTIKNVALGLERPLPEWKNWGELFVTGFKMLVVGLIYSIPLLIIMGIILVPLVFGSTNNDGQQAFAFMMLMQLLNLVFSLAILVISPSICMQFAKRESIFDAISVRKIVALIRTKPAEYFIVCLLSVAASWIASIGLFALVIGFFFTTMYAYAVNAGLFGQYMRLNDQTPVDQANEVLPEPGH